MNMYEGYHFWGMHSFWWVVWVLFLIWIFVTPYNLPGQKSKRDTPLNILQKRFALGEIDDKEYQEKKDILENN